MSITGLINGRPFGAVVPDVSDEVRCLEDIRSRNARFPQNPLSKYFVADLLAPLELREFGAAAHLPSDWQAVIAELTGFIERAIDRLWGSLSLVYRPHVFDWRNPELGAVEEHDFPRWAHEAATGLLRWSINIFRRGGDADPGDNHLLDMARSYVSESRQLTDAQIFTCLAVAETTKALRLLGEVVTNTEGDDAVSFWISRWYKADVQACAIRRKVFGESVNEKIAAVFPAYLASRVIDVMEYRLHAEKLMLLADALNAGMLSPDAAAKLAMDEARFRQKEQKRIEAQRELAEKGANATRVLTDAVKGEIRNAAITWKAERPSGLKKELYSELGDAFGVSIDSIKRALGVKR